MTPKRFDIAFPCIFVALYAIAMLYTIPDYGITWDTWEYYVGDKNFNFYRTFDSDYLDYAADNISLYKNPRHPDFYTVTKAYEREIDVFQAPHLIWPFGHMTSSCTKYVFFGWLDAFDPIDAHHLILIVYGIVLYLAIYSFSLRHFGRWEALFAVCAIALHPRFWAHGHNNLKDVPVAVLFALVITLCFDGVVRNRASRLVVAAILWGAALATKANALFVPPILGVWLVYRLACMRTAIPGAAALRLKRYVRYVRYGDDPDMARVVSRRGLVAILAFPVIGVAVMFLCWPLLWVDFPHYVVLYIQSLFDRGIESQSGWNPWPLKNLLATLPIGILILTVAGLCEIGVRSYRRRRLDDLDFLVLLWFVVPVLRVSLPGARDFDVIRHWLEIVPAMGLIAGIGGGKIVSCICRHLRPVAARDDAPPQISFRELAVVTVVLAAGFGPLLYWNIRAHPNNLVFYNRFVGQLAGAQKQNMPESTDYWGSSYRQGMEWLYFQPDIPEKSVLFVGVAQHIAYYTREIRLRPDIELRPFTGLTLAEMDEIVTSTPGHVYVMYITRKPWYTPLLRHLDSHGSVAWELQVDGGVLLRILRFR